MSGNIRDLIAQLKRRKVFRAAAVYAVVAFIVWQVADIAFPGLGLPAWSITLVLALTIIGFPVALVLAWSFEAGPEGVRPETPAPEPTLAATHAGPTVVVLPFDNLSSESGTEYFADGVTEEITHALARVQDLRVVARTTAFALKRDAVDASEIGRRFGVTHVLEGSVRRAGDRLRITAQLIDADEGVHIWSDRYDRELDDVFAIQDEIARNIAGHLSSSLESPPSMGERVPSLPAYDAYLRGRSFRYHFDPESLQRAIDSYRSAIDRDPEFAPAHAGLAEVHTMQALGFGTVPTLLAMRLVRESAERALELDPELAEAHVARGLVSMYADWDYQAAKRSLDQAIRLNPSSVPAHMWMEFFHTYVECSYEGAMAAIGTAVRLDPLDLAVRARVATVEYLLGDLGRAESLFLALLDDYPRAFLVYAGLGDVLTRQGRLPEAVDRLETAIDLSGGLPFIRAIHAGVLAVEGQEEEAREILAELERQSEHAFLSDFWLAAVDAALGELDAAFERLDRAFEDRDAALMYLDFVPTRFGLRGDPRHAELLRRMGREPRRGRRSG